MPDESNSKILPDHYVKPSKDVYQLVEEDITIRYRLGDDGKVHYVVHDSYEHTHETHSCTLHQFEMGLAAMVDDSQLTAAEYEDAELSQGPSVRWIP